MNYIYLWIATLHNRVNYILSPTTMHNEKISQYRDFFEKKSPKKSVRKIIYIAIGMLKNGV